VLIRLEQILEIRRGLRACGLAIIRRLFLVCFSHYWSKFPRSVCDYTQFLKERFSPRKKSELLSMWSDWSIHSETFMVSFDKQQLEAFMRHTLNASPSPTTNQHEISPKQISKSLKKITEQLQLIRKELDELFKNNFSFYYWEQPNNPLRESETTP
jgi:hypothetical protein